MTGCSRFFVFSSIARSDTMARADDATGSTMRNHNVLTQMTEVLRLASVEVSSGPGNVHHENDAGADEVSAFSDYYDRWSDAVYSMARRIAVHEGLAEQVVEEVFWTEWRMAQYRATSRLSHGRWIIAVTERIAMHQSTYQASSTRSAGEVSEL
jgi:hypothetical protein